MKQTLFNCALVIASSLCIAGCGERTDSSPAQSNVKYIMRTFSTVIYSICIEVHDYIVFDGYRKGGIIHSESCPCKKEDNDEYNR